MHQGRTSPSLSTSSTSASAHLRCRRAAGLPSLPHPRSSTAPLQGTPSCAWGWPSPARLWRKFREASCQACQRASCQLAPHPSLRQSKCPWTPPLTFPTLLPFLAYQGSPLCLGGQVVYQRVTCSPSCLPLGLALPMRPMSPQHIQVPGTPMPKANQTQEGEGPVGAREWVPGYQAERSQGLQQVRLGLRGLQGCMGRLGVCPAVPRSRSARQRQGSCRRSLCRGKQRARGRCTLPSSPPLSPTQHTARVELLLHCHRMRSLVQGVGGQEGC